ncbi:MAG TPA: hypothetical protein VJ599_08710 [Nitrososphaeraceae archaeon]|nr:hypothetical protein [Nitrososphaeraceae archaeon]
MRKPSCIMDPLTEKPERIAFIAYNIGVYESIQKFASLILSGKINNSLDTDKIAQLLSETLTFYDAELISQLINVLIKTNPKSTITRIDTNEVNYVVDQLRACGVSLP